MKTFSFPFFRFFLFFPFFFSPPKSPFSLTFLEKKKKKEKKKKGVSLSLLVLSQE